MRDKDKVRLVVIGGGIAGAEIIRHIGKASGFEVTLIEPKQQIECAALYPDYLGGIVRAQDLLAPLLPFCDSHNAAFVNERAVCIEGSTVVCTRSRVEFDRAVIAVGAVQNYFGIPGTEHTFSVNTLEETMRARRFLDQESPSRIMIIGSGLTGIETASDLADSLEADIYIVEAMPRILPQFPDEISNMVQKVLEKKGINILTNAMVSKVEPGSITFSDGSSLDCDMSIWTTGIKPPAFVEAMDLPKKKGWILVDEYFRAVPSIYAIGDCAWIEIDGKLATKTGIEAERQGKHVAKNMIRLSRNEPKIPYSIIASTDNPVALISTGNDCALGIYGKTCLPIPSRVVRAMKIWIDKSIINRYKI
jgi:NADH dehydrogenase